MALLRNHSASFLLILVGGSLLALSSVKAQETSNSYQEANRVYKEAFLNYLNAKSELTELLAEHEAAKVAVPRAKQRVIDRRSDLASAESLSLRAEADLEQARSQLEVVQRHLEVVEQEAMDELDQPSDADLIDQIEAQKEAHQRTVASYNSDIEVVSRKVARVKRSPDYNFYVREIDIRKTRLNRLLLEEEGAKEDLVILGNELSRLNRQLRIFQSRLDEAQRILPSLAEEIAEANRELEAAQESGDESRLQLAQSNFDQAHSNHRRFEIQRNESEQGILEKSTQVERKTKLSDEKEKLLGLISQEKVQVQAEWDQLYTDYTDYHQVHLKESEARLAELNQQKEKVSLKIAGLEAIAQRVVDSRQAVVDQDEAVVHLSGLLEQARQGVRTAQANLESAEQAVGEAESAILTTKESYNGAVQNFGSSYQTALDKQIENAEALQAEALDARLL